MLDISVPAKVPTSLSESPESDIDYDKYRGQYSPLRGPLPVEIFLLPPNIQKVCSWQISQVASAKVLVNFLSFDVSR